MSSSGTLVLSSVRSLWFSRSSFSIIRFHSNRILGNPLFKKKKEKKEKRKRGEKNCSVQVEVRMLHALPNGTSLLLPQVVLKTSVYNPEIHEMHLGTSGLCDLQEHLQLWPLQQNRASKSWVEERGLQGSRDWAEQPLTCLAKMMPFT